MPIAQRIQLEDAAKSAGTGIKRQATVALE
jgi:hypothetical protein